MANIEHVNITDPNIHEPKGIAAASANRVYVSNGTGGGSWSQITSPVIAAGATTDSMKRLLHVQNQTNSESYSGATGWQKVHINTIVYNGITGSTLSSNAISLPAGTYYVEATTLLSNVGGLSALRIYNSTTSSTILSGIYARGGNGSATVVEPQVSVSGRIVLAGTNTIELDKYVTSIVDSIGNAAISGVTSVITDIKIWDIG